MTTVPVRVPPGITPGSSDSCTGGKAPNSCTCDVSRRIIGIGRICRVCPCSVNNRRVIGGHIDDLRVGRLDNDDLFFYLYDLLFSGLQVA
jgi:hypothetical protein